RVGNISAPVMNDTAYLTGLSIPIPNGGSGAKVEVLITYVSVGSGGISSGSTSKIRLTKVKYMNGSGAQTMSSLTVDGPQMTLVGSKPTITFGLPNGATGTVITGLSGGQKYVADVNIKADESGDIGIKSIPVRFNGNVAGTQVTITDSSDLIIKDASGSSISGYTVGSIVGSGTSSASAVITFSGAGYRINAGQTVTFKIEANVSAVASDSSLITDITPGSSFTWTDIAGGGATGARDASNGVMPNYPTTAVSMRS
ncbi:MAG: hypothetical protein PHS95_01650, partial [Candidatus Pacebacteria bacterium]|nr:hypothetical protein [Candidatus Paceibacterota bacterium]